MKIVILSLLVAILFSSLTGCSAPKPEEIVGEWIPARDAPKIIKSGFLPKPIYLTEEPYFVFNPDGTFIAGHMPEALLVSRSRTNIITGKGNWSIDRYEGSDIVRLKFTEGISAETYLEISRGIKNITLYLWIVEPGVGRFNFVKKKVGQEPAGS